MFGAEGGKLGAPSIALTPGVWLKGSGTWLEQDDSAKTSAYGRTYRYDLSRDLDLWNLEGGVDFGKRGVWAEGDALLFGILGGAVLGSLDYDQLNRKFDIEGGEVGGYVTYLSGGLFVDTLAKADFLEFDTNRASGLPSSLDATTWGVRTDALGSVWGHLSGENEATVTSLGTSFGPFSDEPDDVWGEVSTGVNFFSPGANTSLFGKVDVTFGEEIDGISARGGVRHSW